MRNIVVKLLTLCLLLFIFDLSCEAFTIDSKVEAREYAQQAKITNIQLARIFLDGDSCIELVITPPNKVNEVVQLYSDWELVDIKGETIYFRKFIDDISPLLKTNGYFGITTEGVLSIYYGEPKQQQLIQSFFQIDIEKLESKFMEDLIRGIPVQTKEHYVQVIETFKRYYFDETG